jgi:hypothetical protein
MRSSGRSVGNPEGLVWEYKVIKIGPSASPRSETFLNELGMAGWEMIAFQPSDEQAYSGEGTFYFKRPRQGRAI